MATAVKNGYRTRLDNPQTDRQIVRDRKSRLMAAIVSTALMVFGPALLLGYWSLLVSGSFVVGSVIGFCIGIFGLAPMFVQKRMIISNPEYTAYVTLDPIKGEKVAYGEGLHVSYLWEQRTAEGNYSLKVISDSFEVEVSTPTSNVVLELSYGFRRSLKHLIKSIGADPNTVEKGLRAFMDSFTTAHCAGMPGEKLLTMTDELNDLLGRQFVETDTQDRPATDLEEMLGFEITSLVITNIRPPKSVQKARDSVDRHEQMMIIVADMKGVTVAQLKKLRELGTMKDKEFNELYNRALVNSGVAGANIHIIEGQTAGLMVNGGGGNSRGRNK